MNSKAQAWYMDFTIAGLLFVFTLVVYFSYINNAQSDESTILDTLLTEAQSISSSLVLSGYPSNWDNDTVVRIGVADEQYLNTSRLRNFKNLNYTKTKRIFGTPFEYFTYFTNSKGEVLNINGVCGIGYPLANFSYNAKSAYFYQDSSDSFLKDFMQQYFKADIYFSDNPSDDNDIDSLVANLSKYNLVILEQPALQPSRLSEHYREFNNYTARGGNIMFSGELTTSSSSKDLNGIIFDKKTGASEPSNDRKRAIVNNTDTNLKLNINDTIQFAQYYFVNNDTSPAIETDQNSNNYNPVPATNFYLIANFNQSDDKAIARWNYGNGTAYFFGDFDVAEFSGNFLDVAEDAAKVLAGGTCSPINLTGIKIKNLAKTERYLIYKPDIVKMVVYSWQ